MLVLRYGRELREVCVVSESGARVREEEQRGEEDEDVGGEVGRAGGAAEVVRGEQRVGEREERGGGPEREDVGGLCVLHALGLPCLYSASRTEAGRIKHARAGGMLGFAFVVDSVLVCAVASLAQCAERGDAPYISELMLLCKRGGHAFLPWLCLAAFVLLIAQLARMQCAARTWRALCVQGTMEGRKTGVGVVFWVLSVAAVAGFALVVACDWRDAGAAATAGHRAGVVLLAFDGFGALQVVWWTLREGDDVARLRGVALPDAAQVPWYSWVEVDVIFVVVLALFMVTTLVGEHKVLSAVCEYAAFALLLVQTTWLLVLCAERERVCRMRNVQVAGHVLGDDARVHGMGWALSALLMVYAGEALLVLVVVL